MEEVFAQLLGILLIVVGFAFLVFLVIKIAKKDILMTRIATLLSVSWLFFLYFIIHGYFRPERFVTQGLFPLVLFWGFAWIANAWIEKRGSNE